MATDDRTFYIEGIDGFVRDLGNLPGRSKESESDFLRTSASRVVEWAQAGARELGGAAGKSAKDIRTGGLGEVRYGGKPYNMGAEFGSYQYKQFDMWRGSGDDAGYFIWPAIRRFRDHEMIELWLRESWDVLSEAFAHN